MLVEIAAPAHDVLLDRGGRGGDFGTLARLGVGGRRQQGGDQGRQDQTAHRQLPG
jgi:hypothetical protein